MIYLSYTLRAISIAGRFGLIEAEIPTIAVPVGDDTFSRFAEKPSQVVDSTIPLVLLSRESFVYGSAKSFAVEITNVRNKFYVPHVEGAPNLPRLIKELDKWMALENIKTQPRVLIFLPLDDIPMPIVIQCMAALKESGLFQKVILGGGLI